MGAEYWQAEHGAGYAVPDEVRALVASGALVDESWHNDTSPRFRLAVPKWARERLTFDGACLWVEHPDPEQREGGPTVERFAVTSSDETFYRGEDLAAALEELWRRCACCGRLSDGPDGLCLACRDEALTENETKG